MKFTSIPVEDCAGAILAHTLKAEGVRLKKGRRLTAEDAAALRDAGVSDVVALRLDLGDVPEDEAAERLGAAIAVEGVRIAEAATGRVNIFAATNGLFRADRPAVDAFNRIDPAITFASLNDRVPVKAGEMVATIKIIPLAVTAESLARAAQVIARPGFIAVKAFAALDVGLIATRLPSLKESVMDKTRRLLEERLAASGSRVVAERRVEHKEEAVAAAIRELQDEADMLIVFGASAVVDPEDVIPAAIRAAGGTVEAVGMPVDPGNLLVLGRVAGKPVIGAPGCARSPKENGFDWVLSRLLAGETVTREEIAGMGVGGLLMEIPTRPEPREKAAKAAAPNRVEAVILAAGKASRMGRGGHKLLAEFDGVPLIRRVVEETLRAEVTGVTVVTGHRAGDIAAALEGLDCRVVHNAAYESGMASSLAIGLSALNTATAGLLVILADMPGIRAAHLGRLVETFQRHGGKAIVRAVAGEKRGNPVILPRAAFDAVRALKGDVGARHIVESGELPVVDVDIGEAARLDVDTPEAVREAGGVLVS
jgi:molybdenum cofactor cytidylyltransferase